MKLLVFSLVTLASISSYGVPKLHTSCGQLKNISTPKNGAGVFFDESCMTAYVLPPKRGSVQVTEKSKTTSLGYCPGINAQRETIVSELKRVQRRVQQLGIEEAGGIDNAKPECVEAAKKRAKYEVLLSQYEAELNSNMERLQSLGDDPKSKSEKNYLMARNDNLRADIAKVNARLNSTTDPSCIVKEKNEDDVAISEKREALTNELKKLGQELVGLSKSFENHVGGTYKLLFEDNHEQLVDAYRKANSGIKANFQRMPVDWYVAFNIKVLEDVSGKEVLSASLPAIGRDLSITNVDDEGNGTSLFGGSLSANVTLSLPATCALEQQTRGGNGVSAHIVLNAFYKYNVLTKRRYHVEYKMHNVYNFIKTHVKKNGFFRSRSSTDVREFIQNEASFKIKTFSEDPDNAFPKDQEFLEEIRSKALDLALQKLGATPKELPANEAAPEAGAKVAAGALSKCPYMYCQVGAWALNLTHSLFGSSTSSASYLRDIKDQVVEEVEDDRTVSKYGSMGFVARD